MKNLLIFSFIFLLSACVGSSPTSQFYTLRTINSDKTIVLSKNVTSNIGIEPVKIPYMLDRPQIVVIDKNEIEVSISERHRWAEPLAIIIQRKLTEDISAALPNAKIRSKNYALEKFDRSIVIDISKLDATLGDKVSMEAWYSINNEAGKTLVSKKFVLTEQVGTTYEDLITVESDMMQQLAIAIAQTLAKTK